MIALDCTLRDGGYYNNWDFSIHSANRYLVAMEKAKVNAIEIGFRSPLDKIIGRFAKVTDYFIEKNLYIPNVEYFGVMINSSAIDERIAKKIFCESKNSPINLVRSAVHFNKLKGAEPTLKLLKRFGYTTTINLMQAADKSYDEICNAAKEIEKWGCIDILYLADSLGGMNHDSVNYAFQAIREGWSGPMGFHGHNNKGQALNNTLEAIDIGVEWVDSTIMGMGRGPGNTETEYLLGELNKRGFGEFNLAEIYEISLQHFHNLKLEYNWGPSLLYFLSAEYNIHPTYIQTMLSDKIPLLDILKIVNILKNRHTNSFNKEMLVELRKANE